MEEFLDILNEAFKKPCHTSSIASFTKSLSSKPIKVFFKSKLHVYGISTKAFEKISKENLLKSITTNSYLLPGTTAISEAKSMPISDEDVLKGGIVIKGGTSLIRLPLLQSSQIKGWSIYTDYQVDNPIWVSQHWRNLLIEAIKEPKEPCQLYSVSLTDTHYVHKARTKCYN